jgi:hypothetical protein
MSWAAWALTVAIVVGATIVVWWWISRPEPAPASARDRHPDVLECERRGVTRPCWLKTDGACTRAGDCEEAESAWCFKADYGAVVCRRTEAECVEGKGQGRYCRELGASEVPRRGDAHSDACAERRRHAPDWPLSKPTGGVDTTPPFWLDGRAQWDLEQWREYATEAMDCWASER